MKPIVHIWLYDVDDVIIHSHDFIINNKEIECVNTYDTSFFAVSYLEAFEDIVIHWKSKSNDIHVVSVRQLLNNKCSLIDRWIRPCHNLQRIFWGYLYQL